MLDYYSQLFLKLKQHGFLYDKQINIYWRKDFQYYFNLFDWDLNFINYLQKNYEFNAYNILLINSKKCFFLSSFFDVKFNANKIKYGIYFILLGCYVDFVLDNGSTKQKLLVKEKLSWNYCSNYFEKGKIVKSECPIDILFQFVGCGLQEIKNYNIERYDYVINLIKKSIISELDVINENITFSDELVKNKSILFVAIAMIISFYNCLDFDKLKNCAFSIGNIFSIIDDLCDVQEDKNQKQKNIVLDRINNDSKQYLYVINYFIKELEKEFYYLQSFTNNTIYMLILAEVQEWTLSNKNLKERIWCENG